MGLRISQEPYKTNSISTTTRASGEEGEAVFTRRDQIELGQHLDGNAEVSGKGRVASHAHGKISGVPGPVGRDLIWKILRKVAYFIHQGMLSMSPPAKVTLENVMILCGRG